MLAILGFVFVIIGMILHLVKQHADLQFWLFGFAIALVCAEVAWGWNRGGRYGARGV